MTTVWDDIQDRALEQSEALIQLGAKGCRRVFSQRLQGLADAKACTATAPHWVTTKRVGRAYSVTISGNADGRLGRHPCVLLKGLESLADGARLAFNVVFDPDEEPEAQYSIGLVGTVRETGADWYARIDSAGIDQGKGRCSHAIQHAHVGTDPDSPFQARVPVFPLMPWDALDWLLATADPRFEPCTHS